MPATPGIAPALLAAAPALGGGLNADCGSMFGPSAPSDAFGAAAGRPGVWNDLPGIGLMPIEPADLARRRRTWARRDEAAHGR